jgi:uncharacterized protein (TIGR02145 family)
MRNRVKKMRQSILILLMSSSFLYAQIPQQFSYQAVVRDANGNLANNREIQIRISILNGENRQNVYMETHSVETNTNGLFSVKIGAGSPVSGDFNAIDWALGEYHVQTEIDIENNGQYTLTSTTELLSVPYALYAKTAERVLETASETDPVFLQSLAYSITEADTSRWNRKSDGVLTYSVSDSIRTYAVLLSGNQTIQGEKTFAAPVRFISDIDVNNRTVKNVGTPQNATDAANKEYVDVLGLKIDSIKNTSYMDEINILKSEIELLKKSLEEVQLSTGQLVKDIDGNVYKTVTIGTQTWMAENLRVTKWNDGTLIDCIPDSAGWWQRISGGIAPPAYCYYENNKDSIIKYGLLYNWHVTENKNVCPDGWHVPSYDEWWVLNKYLSANNFNYDGTTVINKIAKSMAKKGDWKYSIVEGSVGDVNYMEFMNKSGFSAVPSGKRDYYAKFVEKYESTKWWASNSSYVASMKSGLYAAIKYNENKLTICSPGTNTVAAISIRCVKD